jgi:predicted outer membrane repeat protein
LLLLNLLKNPVRMKHVFNLLILAFCFISQPGTAQNPIYVAAGATGLQNGTSWANAYSNLQTAIDASTSSDTLWVKAGTYMPTKQLGTSTDPRSKAFQLKNTVFMYGGFAGTEIKLNQRTPGNATILSGDLGTALDTSDNAYHVLVGLFTSGIIDQIEIAYGNASRPGSDMLGNYSVPKTHGGGVYLDSSTVTFSNCFIHGNFAKVGGGGMYSFKCNTVIAGCDLSYNVVFGTNTSAGGGGAIFNKKSSLVDYGSTFLSNICAGVQGGGAMRNEMSTVQMLNTIFTQNTCTNGDGGGAMYNLDSNPFLSFVEFSINSTNKEAGAMYNDGSSAIISDATFTGNTSYNGGAMENDGGSNAVLSRVIFQNNTSTGDGGAIHNWKSNIELSDVMFFQNTAAGDGGAMKDYNECSPKITNCTFQENEAGGNGGALYIERDSHPVITNTLIIRNKATLKGGGMYVFKGATPCSPILTNVTIANNRALISGGGAFDDGQGASKLRNSIVYGNIAPILPDVDAPIALLATAVTRDIIGNEYYTNGVTPPFAFSAQVFLDSANNDYRLTYPGPAVDNGDSNFYSPSATPNLSAIVTDIRGADRIMGSNVDLGAFENCDFSVTPTVSLSNSPAFPALTNTWVTFTATATFQGTSPIYAWSINGSLVAVGSDSTYWAVAGTDFSHGDIISVELHSSIACKSGNPSDSVIAGVTSIGLPELEKEHGALRVYPNPNHGIFTLSAELVPRAKYNLSITDTRGMVVYTSSIIATEKTAELEFDVASKLPSGVYFLTLSEPNETIRVTRFVVY